MSRAATSSPLVSVQSRPAATAVLARLALHFLSCSVSAEPGEDLLPLSFSSSSSSPTTQSHSELSLRTVETGEELQHFIGVTGPSLLQVSTVKV